MSLIDLDILGDVIQLSPGLLMAGAALGLVLWLFGWSWHRFWIVLSATIAAGFVGLMHGESLRAQPLLAAALLGIAAGVLALALVRLSAFLAGGTAGLLVVQSSAPHWDQPLVCFVLCGLLGLVLFRWCWMALTSVCGTMLLAYCGLALGHHYRALDAFLWIDQTGGLLNWILGVAAFLGLSFQYLLDRRSRRSYEAEEENAEEDWDVLPGKRTFRWFRRAG